MKTLQQIKNLEALAETIRDRQAPLGVGLHNQCWGGLAIEVAKMHGETTRSFYGMSIHEMKNDINVNNASPKERRNDVMYRRTLAIAAMA